VHFLNPFLVFLQRQIYIKEKRKMRNVKRGRGKRGMGTGDGGREKVQNS